jgi:hypothetical protein
MGYVNANNLNRFRFASPTLGYLSGIKLHVYHIPPAVIIFPASTNATPGSSVVFNAATYGTPPLQFQWRLNGTNISGGTTNSLTVTNIAAASAGNYSLVISDFSGSVTSAVATLNFTNPPVITLQPENQAANPGSNATFTVSATGVGPLNYKWFFNNAAIRGETNTLFTRTNVQASATGNYLVVISNAGGSVTSSIVTLAIGFADDFDSYSVPSVLTNNATTNGYKIFFGATSGGYDFKAVFGFDYSTVTFPTNIPPAPHSIGSTTRGLYLTANKADANAAAAAVNLYPVGQTWSNNFALKFDLWMNWGAVATTEHALFGISCSGNITNRVAQNTSDGLWFAMDGDGGGTTGIRDFSVYRGVGAGNPPVLMTSGFGPATPLGANFDNADEGFAGLFTFFIFSNNFATPAGAAAMRWVTVEVRQENNLITWLLNNVAVAQYTNTFGYTNGVILLGYNDTFASIGDTNNFAIMDNITVSPISYPPVQIVSPRIVGSNFTFSFTTDAYESYSVQWTTNLAAGTWATYTNFYANGTTYLLAIPLPINSPAQFFRVSQP